MAAVTGDAEAVADRPLEILRRVFGYEAFRAGSGKSSTTSPAAATRSC